MSFWSRVFATPDAVSDALGMVRDAGDAMVFTEEERSRADLKRLEWTLEFMRASSGSNLARRLIAVMLVFTFLLIVLGIAVCIIAGANDIATRLQDLLVDTLVDPVGIIIAFYFMSGMVRDYSGRRK